MTSVVLMAYGLCAVGRPPAAEMLTRLSPVALAYIGDAVFETATRERLLWPPSKMNDLSSRVQDIVCAEGQHEVLQRIMAAGGFELTDEERDWIRRGRNASPRGPRRLKPQVYRDSTSFEALVGFLHLTDPDRLQHLLQFVFDSKEAPHR
jgi:ribonuclease-3 family protein